jgi:hypothetical protein
MKLRIAAASAVGVVVIGLLAWPLAKPDEPFEAVRTANLGAAGAVVLLALAFAVGFIGYFVSWPHGREIGILAVPSGLAIWAARTGNMASQIQMSPTIPQRQALLAGIKWEPIFWLLVVAVGFAGVICGQRIRPSTPQAPNRQKQKHTPALYLNAAVALIGSVLIAVITLPRLAQDITMTNGEIGSVMAQPAPGQITFGLIVAFGLAGFIVKHFFDAGYIWPIVASALITPFAIMTYAKNDSIGYLAQNWPAVFSSNAVISILPVQIVSLGTIGAIAGYWTGIRYDFWLKHEI